MRKKGYWGRIELSMQHKIIKTFTFLDESGALIPKASQKRNFYGIGILKHTRPIQLIQKLHPTYEALCSRLKKDETRVEFSFKSTTRSSIDLDLKYLDTLCQDYDWEFNCLYFDTTDKDYKPPSPPVDLWESYVQYSKMLTKKNLWREEQTVLIADYQKKPKQSGKQFEFIALDIPQVYNVLQAESHGVLLIQAVDLLLGGFLYSLQSNLGDKEGNKTAISKKVIEIKKRVGRKKFNCWDVDWSKSSRVERV